MPMGGKREGAGAPKKAPEDRKSHRVVVKVTKAEAARWAAEAAGVRWVDRHGGARVGVTVAEWVRRRCADDGGVERRYAAWASGVRARVERLDAEIGSGRDGAS